MEETIDEKVMLSLVLDEKNTIQAYARYGYFENATQWTGTLPDGFEDNFKPSFYLLKNNEIIENPNYMEPEPPKIGPSNQEKINAQIMLNQAEQQAEQDKFNAQILLKLAGGIK
ncbi:DUF2977 domain-containing protein [Pediococcus acidilactici]|uniref:DUF2977 domain-containing protein n=1 Tax=Pediococcus acidilactici TaxID=1254 RepID=UPI002FBE91E2